MQWKTILGSSHFPKKQKRAGESLSPCCFSSLPALNRRTPAHFRSSAAAQFPLRLLYGSKLKRLCEALEQITSGIYSYSQFLLQVGQKKPPLCWLTMLPWSKWSKWTDVHLFSIGIKPFTCKSFKKYLRKSIGSKLRIYQYLWCVKHSFKCEAKTAYEYAFF